MLRALCVGIFGVNCLLAQSVLGVLEGKIADDVNGQPLVGCHVIAISRESGAAFEVWTSGDGLFSLPLLPPGIYDVSVHLKSPAEGQNLPAQPSDCDSRYRPAEIRGLEVPIAGYVHQDFTISLLADIWQRGLARSSVARDHKTVVQFYGPDVDTGRSQFIDYASPIRGNLEPSISDVVSADFLNRLPLAGRNTYELIGLLPGASSDLATARSLGISVNGQRPSSSSFLLDGRENNNYLITGPFAPVPPEMVEEYRVSTNNFAAEYGRTSGYLANAVTRKGGADWHGVAYAYLQNDRTDAAPKLSSRGIEAGIGVTGPLVTNRLFNSSFFDFTDNHALGNPADYVLPTWAYIDSLNKSSNAWQLLNRFRPPIAGGAGQTQTVQEQPSSTERRFTLNQRFDWTPSTSRTVSAGFTIFRSTLPDYFWSPYPGITSGLHQNAGVASVTWNQKVGKIDAGFRFALSHDSFGWDRPNPSIPRMNVDSGVTLPGNPTSYLLDLNGTSIETGANFLLNRPHHLLKWGGGFIGRIQTGVISTPDGNVEFIFPDLNDFAIDQPEAVRYSDARHAALQGQYVDPDMNRRYQYSQNFLFAQDSFRATERLLLHYGIRYDFMGVPVNAGKQKDALIGLGPGDSLPAKLGGASFLPLPSGAQPLYDADSNNAAARVGFALNLRQNGDSILRGSYGLFYDRPFDNLWLNLRYNDAVPAVSVLGDPNTNYLNTPLALLLGNSRIQGDLQRFPLTLYQPGFRTPYVHSFFLGFQHRLSSSLMLETNYAGSLGRKLLTTDSVNRAGSVPGCVELSGNTCRPDPNIDNEIDYRSNQGTSEYHALVSSLRVRSRWAEARVSYTYSHAIDNQSDPLTGALSQNLQLTQPSQVPLNYRPAGFTAQYDSSSDRGSADFDQRHSVVFYSFFELPSPAQGRWRRALQGWSVAEVAGIRTGHPYSVYGDTHRPFLNNRANLINPGTVKVNTGSAYGNRLLNPASFQNADEAKLGTAGRNAFTGPGFYSADLSISRTFHVSRSNEGRLLVFRLDAYNALNHVNLGNPLPQNLIIASPQFSVPNRGLVSSPDGLLAVAPLGESARRLQLMLRLAF